MNKRIRELAEQAEGTKKHVPAVWQFYDHELEKFAQLIIRECFKAAMIESKGHMNPIDLMAHMKERVGVSE